MGIDAITLSLFLAAAVRLSGPIMLAAIGELVSERAGVFNIGLEGVMLLSAFFAALALALTGSPIASIIIGALSGVASIGVLSILVAVLRADQIVIGIGFNILALGVTSLLRQTLLTGHAHVVSLRHVTIYRIPVLSQWPIVGRGLFSQSPLLYGGVILGLLVWLMLRFGRPGLVLRAAGEGASAADAAGLSVTGIRIAAMLFTGLLTGLGGTYLTIVAAGGSFVDGMTEGRGYLAIAIAIFGRWNPVWVMVTSLLFGAVDALQYQGQSLGIALPPPLLFMLPFVLALVAWVALGRTGAAPADLGRPFLRGSR